MNSDARSPLPATRYSLPVRDEVAAGAHGDPGEHQVHLGYQLDPMAIGRASKTKVNANMGAIPISSGTDEEVEKLAGPSAGAPTR
jgi:thiamine biosynthesis protein ThiC